jgi:hypothetical protein
VAPLLFNYYLRNRPRHLLNSGRAFADNFYGLTPRFPLSDLAALALVNSTWFCTEILTRARNQGSGLAKIQLFEYRQARLPDWRRLKLPAINRLAALGERLARARDVDQKTIGAIDRLLAAEFSSALLRPVLLREAFRRAQELAKRPKEMLSQHA